MLKRFILDELAGHLKFSDENHLCPGNSSRHLNFILKQSILRRFVLDELPGHLNFILKLLMFKRFVWDELAVHLKFGDANNFCSIALSGRIGWPFELHSQITHAQALCPRRIG
jgi:hypothetical protein